MRCRWGCRVGSGAGELTEQVSAAAEQRAQQAWNGQHHMAVRDGQEHVFAQPLGPQELLLLLAGRTEATATAGEGDKDAAPALAAPEPGELVLEKAALQELP